MVTMMVLGACGGRPTPKSGGDSEENSPERRPTEDRAFHIAPHLELAIELQGLDDGARADRLRELAHDGAAPGIDVFVLCRMLFEARPESECRRPLLGQPLYLGGTTGADWPVDPIAIVDDVPILVVAGYMLGGLPEPARDYVEYNLATCGWSERRYAAKTSAQLDAAMQSLMSTGPWMQHLAQAELDFLRAQLAPAQ